MDIDTLRSAPMCEETVLWFEFLLKPELLENHLKKENAKNLLKQFLSIPSANEANQQNANEINTPDADVVNKIENLGSKIGRKQLALKILALKVASFLKWNLDVIESFLPFQKQVQLLSDLCSITSGRLVNLPLSLVHEVPVSTEGSKLSLNFALTLYHCWVIRAQVLKGSFTKTKPFVHIISGPEQTNNYSIQDDLFISSLEPFTSTSIEFLNQIIVDPEPFRMLMFDSFVPLDSNDKGYSGQKFEKSVIISKTELKTQIYYDLCSYYMFIKKYDLAKENIIYCRDNLANLKLNSEGSEMLFCRVTEDDLQGYLLACGISKIEPSLLHRMSESKFSANKNIEDILNEDNYRREIPIIHRKTLELDMEQSSADGIKVVALNTIRYVLDDSNILTNDIISLKYKNSKIIKHLVDYSNDIHKQLNPADKGKIKKYLLNIILSGKTDTERELKDSLYFGKDEIELLKKQQTKDSSLQLSGISVQQDWSIGETNIQKIEVGILERKMISCTTPGQVRKLLVKLAQLNPSQPLWSINKNWPIPCDLRAAILSLKRGFFQDFAYILSGKAHEMIQKKDYQPAIVLLTELKNESGRSEWAKDPTVAKLSKMFEWEKLNVQILAKLENDWPKKPPNVKDQFIVKLKHLIPLITNDIPRLEIVENAIMMAINFNDWNICIMPEIKRSSAIDLCSTFATLMTELDNKNKTPKKFNRDLWDMLVPIFNQIQPLIKMTRRNSSGGSRSDSPAVSQTMGISVLKQFLDKLRDPLVITIMLSLFAKIHNLLKDESNDLNIENLHLWPTSISNANAYNIKMVSETLQQLLKMGLRIYPHNIAWVKLQGDLEFVNGNNETAMKYYVQSIIIATEYCSLPIQRPLIDEGLVRKMIKCSSNLGCFLQAAVLCQFLEEIDYSLAFKCLTEKSSNFQDAMDSYYGCIYDTTMLEYIINLHCKKGEHKRKLLAISFIRQLELNSNNNDEIKREAASIRKIKFIRSLANQYM